MSEPKAFASLSSGLLARKGAARPAMRPQGFGQTGGSLEDLGWNDMGHEAQRPVLASVPSAAEEAYAPPLSRTPLIGLTPASPVHGQQAEIEERFGHLDEVEEDAEFGQAEALSFAAEPESRGYDGEFAGEDDTLELADRVPEAMPIAVSPPVEQRSVEPAEPAVAEVEAPAPVRSPRRPRQSRADAAAAKEKAAFTLRLDPNRHLKLRLACAVNAKSAQQLVTKALDELLSSMPELDAMASQAPERASRKA